MNFEAVPCMLKTGPNGSSVYGLLIRPSTGSSTDGSRRALTVTSSHNPTPVIIQGQSHHVPTCSASIASDLQLVPNEQPVELDDADSATKLPGHVYNQPPGSTIIGNFAPPPVSNAAEQNLQHKKRLLPGVAVVSAPTVCTSTSSTIAALSDSHSPSQVVPRSPAENADFATTSCTHPPPSTSAAALDCPRYEGNHPFTACDHHHCSGPCLVPTTNHSYTGAREQPGDSTTDSRNVGASGFELLDSITPCDLARLLAESESILQPDSGQLNSAEVIESSSVSSYLNIAGCQQHYEGIYGNASSRGDKTTSYAATTTHYPQYQQCSKAIGHPPHSHEYQPAREQLQANNIRPQLEWEQGPNEQSSGTPDSGIQSIAGSPPSNRACTPPMISPALYASTARNTSAHQPLIPASGQITGQDMSSDHHNAPLVCHHAQSNGPHCFIDERPTSSSSSATVTTVAPAKEVQVQPTKRAKKRRKRKGGEFADMPRLFPAFRKIPAKIMSAEEREAVDHGSLESESSCNNGDPTVSCTVDLDNKVQEVGLRFDRVIAARTTKSPGRTLNGESQLGRTKNGEIVEKAVEQNAISQNLVDTMSLDCNDPDKIAERLLATLTPDQIEKFTQIIQTKAGQLGQTTHQKEICNQTGEKDREEQKLARLREFRKKSHEAVAKQLTSAVFAVGSSLEKFHLDEKKPTSARKANCFAMNFSRVEHRIAGKRQRAAALQESKILKLDSSSTEHFCSNDSQSVIVREQARRISLKIKFGTLRNPHSDGARVILPPKKRLKLAVSEASHCTTTDSLGASPSSSMSPIMDSASKGRRTSRTEKKRADHAKASQKQALNSKCKVMLKRLGCEYVCNEHDNYPASPNKSTPKPSMSQASSKTSMPSPECERLEFIPESVSNCAQELGTLFSLPSSLVQGTKTKGVKKIRSNIYVDQPPRASDQHEPCSCPLGSTCSEDCLNRMMFVECVPGVCPCDQTCSNRCIQKHQKCKTLQKFRTDNDRGYGVRTTAAIERGAFICEYVGEVVSTDSFLERMATAYKDDHHHYACTLSNGYVVDAYRAGNIARYINHSCEPNCEMQKWTVNGHHRICLFTRRPVSATEELTYDYKFSAFENGQQDCKCGSDTCRGFIGTLKSTTSPTDYSRPRVPKVLSHRERVYIEKHRIFLLRNYKLGFQRRFCAPAAVEKCPQLSKPADVLRACGTMAARCSRRTVSTRQLTTTIENEKLHRLACLAQAFGQIYASVVACKDEHGRTFIKLGKRTRYQELNSLKERIFSGYFESLITFDRAFNNALETVCKGMEKMKSDKLMSSYAAAKRSASSQLLAILGEAPGPEFLESKSSITKLKHGVKKEPRVGELISTELDLSYLNDGRPVGTCDPDECSADTWSSATCSTADQVRCVCGIFEEDGTMVQCDKCHYWLHAECIESPQEEHQDYECHFCATGLNTIPSVDVLQKPQPTVRLPNCSYYRTLANKQGLQVRLNETVYVKRLIDDEHKASLRLFHQQCVERTEAHGTTTSYTDHESKPIVSISDESSSMPTYHRRDLRVFRVERLLKGPNGERFVFGCYYARPHETFCEPTRLFYRNELFWTPLFDTLPLDAVVARCLVLEPTVYCKGRPRVPHYNEDDVYVCEYRVDKSQRFFEKTGPKNRYYINTDDYAFTHFPQRKRIKRNFTPFIMTESNTDRSKSDTPISDDDLIPLQVIRQNLLSRKKKLKAERLELILQRVHLRT